MSKTNKSYRIKTDIGGKYQNDYLTVDANIVQDYDAFDILSMTIKSVDTYKLHNSNYGVVVGRVLANNGFGIPNAKISIFIQSDDEDDVDIRNIYPFASSASNNRDGVRYNLLPDEIVSDCHQVVGTFPNKRYLLDNDIILEVFDKYYKYTTRTNNSGDYLIIGVPTGIHTLHMDLDLSDCGILSQRPRDFVYKGYTIEQFENPNKFKSGTDYTNLSQIFTQDQVVNVNPFWGNESLGETIGITRADINVSFKFEPTCVFIGSVVSDNASQGITKKCMATPHMGDMDELTTGEGKIEMIRKTPGGSVEEFQVKGTQLINSDGVWCYQIPMNLDYMMTDEYGNMVPTDNPDRGIPTRARVRFRLSMQDNEENTDNFFRPKVLVPNNPQFTENGTAEQIDYEFGTYTREESYRDLFWNNVYSVKGYIPRFQKRKIWGWKEDKFTGIKECNRYGANNPIPYNNIRIKLPLMFTILCALIKSYIRIVYFINMILDYYYYIISKMTYLSLGSVDNAAIDAVDRAKLIVLADGLCPDLEGWYFAPAPDSVKKSHATYEYGTRNRHYNLVQQTLNYISGNGGYGDKDSQRGDKNIDDKNSIDSKNNEESEGACLTIKTDYLITCIEMNLAEEYRVIKFDFYNDWINGMIYVPRFMRYVRPKIHFLGIDWAQPKVKGCMDDTSVFSRTRRYTQLCSLPYYPKTINGKTIYSDINITRSRLSNDRKIKELNQYHKSNGAKYYTIFGKDGGICHEGTTMLGQKVYYLKPCEYEDADTKKVNLFATDIILLGSLNDCDLFGIPQAFKHLTSSSYIMPPNMALTNLENGGPLYADGDAMCSKKTISNAVGVVDVKNGGLESESKYYSASTQTSAEVEYSIGEHSDTIALTEIAGITWNWTGPGQGEVNKSEMYYPGGHFLGLSCTNSESNVKSCLNLSRICEIGATMSQRRDDVRSFDSNGNVKYTYSVPSGFISGDEIIDTEFRTMFATMNQNRLLATKTNPNTGYKMYDFAFLRPSNFGGEFSRIINESRSYNQKIEVTEEDLSAYNVAMGEDNEDFDANESASTQIRTIEDASMDYYMYRFGLPLGDLTKRSTLQNNKFLINNSMIGGGIFLLTGKYLPQYENSYYFYFGMKYGATALDEFNKQFFSQCESTEIEQEEATLTLYAGEEDYDMCHGTGTLYAIFDNANTPFKYVRCTGVNSEPIEVPANERYQDVYSFENLPFGTWKVEAKDDDDIEFSKTIKIADGIASCDYDVTNFTIPQDRRTGEQRVYDGGYITISDIKLKNIEGAVPITIRLSSAYEAILMPGTANDDNFEIDIFVTYANLDYTLYLVYSSGEGCECSFEIGTFSVGNTGIKISFSDKEYLDLPHKNIINNTWWWAMGNNLIDSNGDRNLRESFFHEGNKEFNPLAVHNCSIDAKRAYKVIWGIPQNKDGLSESNDIKCSENIEDIPVGYSLDDESVYFSTILGPDGNKKKAFGISAYDSDNNVWGMYRAIITNGAVSNVDSQYLVDGYGCIYKNIDTNELLFGTFDSTSTEPIKINDEIVENGVIYPSFLFPVYKRPFYADANYYEWENKEVIENDDGDLELISENVVGRGELIVHNGVTTKSVMGKYVFTDIRSTCMPFISLQGTYASDTRYVDDGRDRISTFTGHEIESAYSCSYELSEWVDDDLNKNAKTLYGSISSNFTDGFTYERVGDSYKIKVNTITDAEYSVRERNGAISNCLSASKTILYKDDGLIASSPICWRKRMFVKYNNKNAILTVATLMLGQQWQTVIKNKKGEQLDSYNFIYGSIEFDSTVIRYIETYYNSGDKTFSWTKQFSIDPSFENNDNYWITDLNRDSCCDFMKPDKDGWIKEEEWVTSTSFNLNENSYIVGRISVDTDNGGKMTLYHIYPDISVD